MRIKRKEDSNEKQIRKNREKAISLALAFAVVAVSMFTVIAVSVSAETSAATELTWDGTVATSFSDTTHQGTSWDDAIIISTPQELAYLVKGAGGTTKGKYYKIADGITAFNMDGLKDITLNSTVVDVEAAEATSKNWGTTFNNADTHFNGNFDGNGITVYNIYCASHAAGLFPVANSGSTFKNVAVKNSRLLDNISTTNMAAGGIFGFHQHSEGTIAISNCAVENCQIESDSNLGAGSIAGCARYRNVTVENCAAINNSLKADNGTTGIIGQTDNGSITVKNTINIGSATAPTNSGTYSGVYTTETSPLVTNGVTTIKASDITGKDAITKLSGFDFVRTWWAVSSDLPQLRALHKITATDNGDGTHKSVCQICKLSGFSEEHNYVIDPTTEKAKCSCGLEKTGLTLTWNGTLASGFTDKSTGTAEDPIIITTAEEFAYLVKGAGSKDATKGKYYKVADCIKAFNMNGMTGITVNSTATDVKSATPTSKNWSATVNNNTPFCGIFDGNGVTVYNIYCTNSWAAGLFPCINSTEVEGLKVTIKNVTVTASYFAANSGAYTFGSAVIFGAHINSGNNQKIAVENCAALNSYVVGALKDGDTACIRYGSIGGSIPWDTAYIKNCLISGNKFVDNKGSDVVGALIGQRNGSAEATETLIIDGAVNSSNTNQYDYYGRVYTTNTAEAEHEGVTVVKTDDITGAAAKTTLTGFDFDKVWFANKGTPVLRVFHNIKMTDDGDAGHKYACVDCEISDSTVDHTFDTETHKCTVCEYECKHTNKKWVSNNDGDCSVADTGKFVCDCGYESGSMTNPDFTVGHKLAYVAEKSGNCSEEGYAAHKYCSSCKKYFAADENDVSSTKYIDYDDIKTPKNENNHKSIEFVEYKNATTESTGEKSHYECIGCHKLFSDKDGKTEISKKDIEIPKLEIKADWHISASGWYYEFSDGTFATGWAQINGEWYYFNVSGYMVSNVWIDGYYLSASGAMTTPTWQLDGNGWWYSYGDGTYATGWTDIGGTWYYFNDGGYMVTGWLNLGGTWYYMNTGGAMVTNWQMIGGSWYYFNAGGNMASNVWVGGYYLAPSGVMSTPVWQQNSAGWWYAYGDGSYAIGWEYISGAWYYFNASGYMVTGWQFIDSDWYYFDANGAMTTSVWQSDEDGWKYAYGDGSYAIGWLQIGGQYYYFNSDGYMAIGWLQMGTTNYYLNDSGVMVTDWQWIDGTWYYFDASGAMLRNCWVGDYWLTNSGAINEI